MLIKMHLITLFRVMNPHQRCLQAKVKNRNEPKHVMLKSQDLSRSLVIKLIWTFNMELFQLFQLFSITHAHAVTKLRQVVIEKNG